MPRARLLVAALVASLAVHLALVIVVPGIRWRVPVMDRERIEVQLTRPAPPEPPPVEPPAPAKPVVSPEPSVPAPPGPETVKTLNRVLARVGGTPALPASPPIRLPTRLPSPSEPPELSWSVPLPPGSEPVPIRPRLDRDLLPAPEPSHRGNAAEELLAAVQAELSETRKRQESLPVLDIEWQEGVTRRVLEAPPLPAVEVVNEVEVRIRFWVSPRGEVTRVLPIRRGDATLDPVALAYVKGLRFNGLPAGDEIEQWGTIVVRFRRR